MKGKRLLTYIGSAVMVGAFAFGALLLPVSDMENAEAATLNGTVFEDEFASAALSSKWLKNDFSVAEKSYYSMRLDNQRDYGSAMLYVGYEIHTDCVISFDFYQSAVDPAKAKDNWFGILLGYDDDSAHFTAGNAAILSYGRGQTQMMDDGDGASNKLVNESYNNNAKFSNSFNEKENVLYTVKLVLSYTGARYSDGENLYKVDGYYYEKSGEASLSPNFTYKGVAADGYFGFSAMSSSVMDVSNLQIFEGDTRVVYENFENADGTGKKLLPNSEHSVWKGINCSEVKVYNYFNGCMDTSECHDGLMLSNYYLKADTLNKKTFDISFDAEIIDLPVNSAFGIALGLSKTAVSAGEGSFIGLTGVSDDKFAFVYMKDGEIVAQTTDIPKQLYHAGEAHLSFVGYYDGRVEVKFCGYTATFENAVSDGYVALATLGEYACSVYINDFDVTLSEYISSTSSNCAIDFTGVKETQEDDFVYVERYVDERVWFVGSGVAFQKVFNQNATFIQFADSNERSFFGAKQQYSEFICRFSVTVTQNRADAAGSYIGLSFGKENRNDRAADSPSLMFGMTNNGMVLQSYHCALQGADSKGVLKQYETYPTLDFWSAEDWKSNAVTYRVMVVARGGNVYLYYANEADLSEMNVCKAVVTDVATSGYVTVSALGGATFRLNDFAVTNIALNNKAETASISANAVDNEYVNVDFTNSALYAASGASTGLGKGISLGYDSQVAIKQTYTDFLAYVDVNSVAGKGIALKVGEQSVFLNSDGSVYSQMKKIGGSGKFDFNTLKTGGVIMLERVGSKLSVGVVGTAQPTDLLENFVAVYEFVDSAKVNVSVATIGETVLSLESVRLYTLKPTIAIATDNWEPSDVVFKEKDAPAGAESVETADGCSGAVASGALLPVMALALAFIAKKRETKDE